MLEFKATLLITKTYGTIMNLSDKVLAYSNDLPIKTELPVHSGKVRSVYWLSPQESRRLIEEKGYPIPAQSELAIMVISDRISAFECIWRGEGNMEGVPGKGAALNSISNHWFKAFKSNNLADSHILDVPHPLVWIVQKARPVMIEAICRQYITGSMWRGYLKGEREICGIRLDDNLKKDQKLDQLLITPSTKGILRGLEGVPEVDDVNISRRDIETNLSAFKFNSHEDINLYEKLLHDGFKLISDELETLDQIFVDTKFEFGYVKDSEGEDKLIYMDEVGTPDSSRIWDGAQYRNGKVIENSKEVFRQLLLNYFPDPDILVNKDRMSERYELAKNNELPQEIMSKVSDTYLSIANKITKNEVSLSDNPKEDILDTLNENFALIK